MDFKTNLERKIKRLKRLEKQPGAIKVLREYTKERLEAEKILASITSNDCEEGK